MLVKLLRISSSKTETAGVLLLDSKPMFTTLEPPWQDNKQALSCIPDGEYICAPWKSHRFGNVIKVMDVPGRFDILFHSGNYARDTQGCILVGKHFRISDRGLTEIGNSKIALDEMRILLGGLDKFTLKIESYGVPKL